jgi:hypothetical protein
MTFFSCAGTRSILPEMASTAADDSVVLNTSRDSDSGSVTDDERLERRMRRAVLDPAYLDGNFSEDENHRVLRSSRRDEDVAKEQLAMETEAVPSTQKSTQESMQEAAGGTGGSVATVPAAENSSEKPSDNVNITKTM